MKVKTSWNLGNFTVALSAEVTEDVRDRLANYGLRHLGQRVTEVDKALGAFQVVDGKPARKKGWKRGDVEYSVELAHALIPLFRELAFPDDPKDKVQTDITIGECVRDAVASKFTEEKAICGRHESAGDLEEWLLETVGYADATHGEDGEFAEAMLRAVREFKIKALRSL